MLWEKVNVKVEGGLDFDLPRMFWVEQKFNKQKLDDVRQTTKEELNKVLSSDLEGKRIAITAGSRGISNISSIVKAIADFLKEKGAKPFVVPAMGSHGGATAEGQRELLAEYGITEEAMGVPIVSSMDVVEIGTSDDGVPVYCDKEAYNSDGIVVCNRVKPHTDYRGPHESGLLKMMAIGLGKHKGATAIHKMGFDRFETVIPNVGKVFLKKAPILCGVAIVENAYHETMLIEAVKPERFVERDKALLKIAKENMPRFLLSHIDLLIVDEIGKDISGDGMDPNVIGRTGSRLPGFETIPIQKIAVLDLTEDTNGNGIGIGLADVTSYNLVRKLDLAPSYINAITSTVLEGVKIPVVMNSDREAIALGLATCNRIEPKNAGVVRIKNTLSLYTIEVSEAYLNEVEKSDVLVKLTEPAPWRFDAQGNLIREYYHKR
ncbi:MAG: hypothetical protein PWR28_526 [Synergistaceae bacterium]|nr:hypothetical protein [Synergistaceae bacterium]